MPLAPPVTTATLSLTFMVGPSWDGCCQRVTTVARRVTGRTRAGTGLGTGEKMGEPMNVLGPGTRSLIGRSRERRLLSQLLDAVRAGESRTLVITGEPGVGKTALLD